MQPACFRGRVSSLGAIIVCAPGTSQPAPGSPPFPAAGYGSSKSNNVCLTDIYEHKGLGLCGKACRFYEVNNVIVIGPAFDGFY